MFCLVFLLLSYKWIGLGLVGWKSLFGLICEHRFAVLIISNFRSLRESWLKLRTITKIFGSRLVSQPAVVSQTSHLQEMCRWLYHPYPPRWTSLQWSLNPLHNPHPLTLHQRAVVAAQRGYFSTFISFLKWISHLLSLFKTGFLNYYLFFKLDFSTFISFSKWISQTLSLFTLDFSTFISFLKWISQLLSLF